MYWLGYCNLQRPVYTSFMCTGLKYWPSVMHWLDYWTYRSQSTSFRYTDFKYWLSIIDWLGYWNQQWSIFDTSVVCASCESKQLTVNNIVLCKQIICYVAKYLKYIENIKEHFSLISTFTRTVMYSSLNYSPAMYRHTLRHERAMYTMKNFLKHWIAGIKVYVRTSLLN